MIAKQISKAYKKSFFEGYKMQPSAKFYLFYKLRYVMNRCFSSEEKPFSLSLIFKPKGVNFEDYVSVWTGQTF